MNTPAFTKTRIAPTPSGYLHLGNILSFAITAILADHAGAKVLLRIDDADRERTNKAYVQDIFDTLNFLEIPWHEGPRNMQEYEREYSQVHRVHLYERALQQLGESGEVFACTCSRTDLLHMHPERIYTGTCLNKGLPLDTKDSGWRVRTAADNEFVVRTIDGAVSAVLPLAMYCFMAKKRDGFAAYQLTSVVDDVHFGVDLIVRGADLWPSTVAQQYLAAILGIGSFAQTIFHHHPLFVDAEGNKMSKSAGSASVHHLRAGGASAADIYALIGDMLGLNTKIGSLRQLAGEIGTNLLSLK